MDTTTGNKNFIIPLLSFVTGKLQSCSIKFSSNIINSISNAIITIKTLNPVNQGILRIFIPNYWTNSFDNSVRIVSNQSKNL
jgi:hypothetical protein